MPSKSKDRIDDVSNNDTKEGISLRSYPSADNSKRKRTTATKD
jgi:hypothetical protein